MGSGASQKEKSGILCNLYNGEVLLKQNKLLLTLAMRLFFKKYISCLNQLKLISSNEVVAAKVLSV